MIKKNITPRKKAENLKRKRGKICPDFGICNAPKMKPPKKNPNDEIVWPTEPDRFKETDV